MTNHARVETTAADVLLLTIVASSAGQNEIIKAAQPPAVPLEPIAAILDAFRSHSVVALGKEWSSSHVPG